MTVIYRLKMKGVLSTCLLVAFLMSLPVAGLAVEEAKKEESAAVDGKIDLNFQVVKGDYEYQIEDRSDPFVPFYTGEANSTELDPNEIVENKARLTGMQLFEPGQLNLVALMKFNNNFVAMVEDFKGQGYVIREGTKIGRRGTVMQIVPNKVIIEEVAVTRAGKELRSEIVMALRKEGDE